MHPRRSRSASSTRGVASWARGFNVCWSPVHVHAMITAVPPISDLPSVPSARSAICGQSSKVSIFHAPGWLRGQSATPAAGFNSLEIVEHISSWERRMGWGMTTWEASLVIRAVEYDYGISLAQHCSIRVHVGAVCCAVHLVWPDVSCRMGASSRRITSLIRESLHFVSQHNLCSSNIRALVQAQRRIRPL